MKTYLLRLLSFLLIAIAGYYAPLLLTVLLAKFNLLPAVPAGPALDNFRFWLFGVTSWIWIAASLLSAISVSLSRPRLRRILLWTPLYAPLIFVTGLMLFYSMSASVSPAAAL